jgi:hypothetical protein
MSLSVACLLASRQARRGGGLLMRDRPANTAELRTPPPVRFGRRALLSFATVFAAAVGFAIQLLLVKSKSTGLLHFDNTVADELHEYVRSHRTFTSAMRLLSDLGTSLAWWIILIPVVGWLAYRRLPRLVAFVLVTAIGSSLLNNAIKLMVNRARPHLADPVAIAGGGSFRAGMPRPRSSATAFCCWSFYQ